MTKQRLLIANCRKWKIGLCLMSLAMALFGPGVIDASANGATTAAYATDAQQQKRHVSGTVTDASGEPIAGAMVQESGTNNVTITRDDGSYSFEVVSGASIEVSLLGFSKQTVAVGNRSSISFQMEPSATALDEIVVTGFGLSQRKATLTGAVSTIGASDIERSSSVTASGALVGKIAGLNTRQPDGRPGASTQIRIRNMGTPLYVIDGIQSDEGQFNNINFRDIENISILKDATAAIYGVRAANGVVVVTTKRGTRNTRSSVSVNGDGKIISNSSTPPMPKLM